ncbi:MAG: PaaI family thioesterase [Gemmataceae bacterium]|nr:PaaI family thioesterase [Gemmataceae bacterium]
MTLLDHGRAIIAGTAETFPVARLLGIRFVALEPDRAVFSLDADERHHNPLGTLHGGVYSDLADAAMGWACAATLAEGESFTTVELKVQFLRAVRKDTITAEAKVVKAGASIAYVECDVTDGQGRLVARASSTCLKLKQA